MRYIEILFLNQDDVSILLTMADAMKAVEDAFKEKGLGYVQMPPKSYIYFRKYDGDLRVMLSYIERGERLGVKVVNAHPNNPLSKGLPSVMAVITLFDPKTGAPFAVMDGTYITASRTGAASGVAIKYLARKESSVLGLVGAGRQAISRLEAITEVVSLSDVRVYDLQKDVVQSFVQKVEERFDCNFTRTDSIEECIKGSDIISTLTPSRQPLVKDKWIEKGIHINAIGADAPGKQELGPHILKGAKIVVDDWEQACHSGEINVPLSQGFLEKKDIYGEFGDIFSGVKRGRENNDEVTVFDSTGLSIQDVATAWLVYERANDKGVGTLLTLFK